MPFTGWRLRTIARTGSLVIADGNLVDYLLDRGLTTPEAIITGDLSVVEVSSRNRNIRVLRGALPGLFIKQVKRWEPDTIATLDREAACFWLGEHDPGFAALRGLLPREVCFDAERHLLITELVEGETLSRHHLRLGAFPIEVGWLLGRLLASFHGAVGQTVELPATYPAFPKKPPWLATARSFANTPPMRSSGGARRLFEIVREFSELHAPLAELRERWRTDSFVHGDLRWDNILVTETDGRRELRLVDWELADFGDALWDVGGIFFAYLSSWVFSMAAWESGSVEQLAQDARFPLDTIQPAMGVFWHTYAAETGVASALFDGAVGTSIQYAAARMVQSAYEQAVNASDITPHAVLLLQLSANILRDPAAAVHDLLGM